MLPLRMLGIGLLMLSLCDADTACPEKLSLDPPEIIEEYGTEVFVNCTSTVEHDGMYWIVRNKSFHIELEENFISQSVLLSDWDVTAECKIMLNESHECSKELEMTIYKNPEVIHSIKRVRPTPKETQYDLDCDTINVAPVQNLTVKWYKNDELLDTNFFKDKTKTPVNVSSPLLITVNRGEEVQMRCEAQLNFVTHGLQLPVISQTFNLSAQYPPELNPEEETESIFVLQDDDITLNCPAEGNPPPVFRWTYDGMTMAESSNTLKVTHINASATYTCTASNYLGNTTKQIHIHVKQGEAAPATLPPAEPATPEAEDCPLTVTPSEIVVRFGDPASVNCSTSATDAVGMGWESPVGGTGFERPPVVTWMVEKLEDWTAAPLCYITLNTTTGTEQCNKSSTVTLYKTPDTVSVSAVQSGPMVEGTNFHLKCDISNVAPVQKLKVKWYRDNETVSGEMFLDTNKTPQNVFSTHIITPERDYDGSQYRCEAELHLGPNGPDVIPTEISEPYTAIVHYKPFIKACPSSYTAVEDQLSMDMLPCSAGGNPPPTVQWYHQGKLINSSEPLTRFDTGKYTAEIRNILGSVSTSVEITIEYKPFFECMDHYKIEMNVGSQTKCEPKGNPAPTITWFKDGKLVNSPLRWTNHDSGNYSLKAANKHGTAEHAVYLDVLYAPQFKEGNSTKEMSLGENVTLECSAEGNPAPFIHWNLSSAANLKETTVGRQKIITITRATSTNAGVYICVATNEVGTVTRSVTLVMKGSNAAPMAVIWGLLIAGIILFTLIAMVLLHNHQKKHGEYSFLPANTKDSNVPMTTLSEGGKA
ncbi:hemicentin-1 isoform X3 [Acanthochromis polyacanthus]|uniref:hemicentin-1 isoform X3 n=1 Tax=Acanthochromis polyacanthus TaxID=80966 RepID=UPI0022348960|nr:hemicentin-1 isoform X3 [Acanthochromis polyacanthus]